jgi:uncharacterized membrane protein
MGKGSRVILILAFLASVGLAAFFAVQGILSVLGIGMAFYNDYGLAAGIISVLVVLALIATVFFITYIFRKRRRGEDTQRRN